MNLSDRILNLRKEHGFTLRDLAARADLSPTYLSEMERDKVAPSMKALVAVAGAFNMTLLELLHGVQFAGEARRDALPPALQDFLRHPDVAGEIDADWLAILRAIRLRGQTPASVREWMSLYLHLRLIFGKEAGPGA
jgi:transcriptional regulator with XRE-family HTH domain